MPSLTLPPPDHTGCEPLRTTVEQKTQAAITLIARVSRRPVHEIETQLRQRWHARGLTAGEIEAELTATIADLRRDLAWQREQVAG